MAPYLGLLTRRGELAGHGYARKDLSDLAWRVSSGEREGDDLTVFNAASIHWEALPEGEEVTHLAVFNDVLDSDILVQSEIGPLTTAGGLSIPRGRLRLAHRFRRDGQNIDTVADSDTTDRWREALVRIAEAPVNVRSRELRAIARVALLME